ncbi:MAG: Crp/Fnr family transcriptional regulator [Nitrospirae bacterium]|nr:Crp/Fnr family transcriptional regulator [Nitrospirota bacterium]
MLSEIGIFGDLNKSELSSLESACHPEKHKKRNAIFSEGDPADWLFILVKGKVKITKLSNEGKELILEMISPPDFFGGLAVVKGFPYPANAVAVEDCEILKMPKSAFLKTLEKHPDMTVKMLGNLIERVKASHENMKNIALEKVDSRIAYTLVKIADKHGIKKKEGILLDTKVTKQELADMVGTTVETTIRIMSKFKKSGYIDDTDGKILIKKMDVLKDFTA